MEIFEHIESRIILNSQNWWEKQLCKLYHCPHITCILPGKLEINNQIDKSLPTFRLSWMLFQHEFKQCKFIVITKLLRFFFEEWCIERFQFRKLLKFSEINVI